MLKKISNRPHRRAALRMRLKGLLLVPFLAVLLTSLTVGQSDNSNAGSEKIAKKLTKLKKIDHIIVVYQENWSFDSLYGLFPGANGLANAARTAYPQVDAGGFLLTSVPQPTNGGVPDPRFNGVTLPVSFYNLA